MNVKSLDYKKRGRPFFLGEELDYQVQAYVKYALKVLGRFENDKWLGEPGARVARDSGQVLPWNCCEHKWQYSTGGLRPEQREALQVWSGHILHTFHPSRGLVCTGV